MKEPKDVTILVVDDEVSLRKAIAFDFQRKGFNVIQAGNGIEAFEQVLSQNIDVVLTDVRMPGGNGVELLDKIKARDPKLPVVIFITGFSDMAVEDAYDKGADAVFSKPFNRQALLDAVNRAVKSKYEQWQLQRSSERIPVSSEKIKLSFPTLDQALRCRVLNIGRGGMFVALEPNMLATGSELDFRIQFTQGELPAIEGQGVVRWTRSTNSEAGPAGCGIEFISLSVQARVKIIEFINQCKTKSFIPKS